MTDEKPRVIIIPPKPEFQQTTTVTKQLRVAAYCRVSTKEEEQTSSYEAQCEYYTDKIMSNKEWTMAGIFADEGITGTSTKKRTEFLRMIRQCKQKKIDLILTKSIQRFARNTLDCINYTRILRQLGIGVLFEKENINSLPPDSEFMITMYGAMAQSESESISGNIRRGRQMHAKVGTLKVPCCRLYGYEKDADGKFRVIPEQAEIVREVYKRYESGASLRNLQDWLEENQIKTVLGESKWTTTSIKSILTNEKYCGDVLLQKTFRTDVISKKVIKNVGQMAQYYMPDHHEAIVSREQYNAVKAEMARRSALRSQSKQAVTGRSCYTSKYALSDRLVCGECGTLYRRCTWTSLGRKYPVWRCMSRLNYGTKYCHNSPTIKEEPLQVAILAAINSAMSNKPALLDLIKSAVSLELLPVQGQTMSLADIEQRLAQLDEQFQQLLAEANVFHLLRGDVELPCKDFPVALRLIEHEDKIAVLKDILNFAAAQKVFDILRDGGWDPAPFTKTLPNLHGIGGGLFLLEEQMKLVHVVAGGFLFSPVYGYSVPYLILHNEHPQLFIVLDDVPVNLYCALRFHFRSFPFRLCRVLCERRGVRGKDRNGMGI